ncbi:unnamed protein product [Brassicogethes aeneus]|uniref:Uncharacterized protein n=1 Tax=Brassicogethes aeneus TaxID=1431903 RepID=A0A9P0AZY4_BRAAE|nr:unnamed protein product [Brassicogethes aeneus]
MNEYKFHLYTFILIIIILSYCFHWCCSDGKKKSVTYIQQQQQLQQERQQETGENSVTDIYQQRQQPQEQDTVVVMNNTSAPQPMVHPQAEYPSAPRPYDYGLGQHMHQSGPSHAYGFMSPDPHSGSRHLPPQYTATVHEKW